MSGDRPAGPGPGVSAFLDMVPGPVCRLDPQGTVAEANVAARRVFGDDLPGRPWRDVGGEPDPAVWSRLLDGGVGFTHEVDVGDTCYVFTFAYRPGDDWVYAYGTDFTELHRARSEMERQAAELRENALFPEMNPGPVCRLDMAGTVVRANRAAKQLFGDVLIGSCWRDVVPGIGEDLWRRILGGEHLVRHEADFDGTCIAFTMAHAEGSQYVFVYGADITELKEAERKISEMARFPEMNPGPVLRVDHDGVIVLANRAARELFERGVLVGESWTEICPGLTDARWREIRDAMDNVNHETQVLDRVVLFTHTPGLGADFVFVYGADLTDLKHAERVVRQSEKMATLGTLAAGVAHELNNPAAAVQRAAEHLRETFSGLQAAQLALGRLQVPEATLELLAELDATARERAAAPPALDPVARSDMEYDVEGWLEGESVDDAWDLAPALVGMGLGPGELDELAGRIDDDHLPALLRWLCRTYPVYSVLEEIRHGAGRLSEIVSALKAYSFVGQAPVQAIDVNEGLHHTLIILRNKLKRAITVRLELDEALPRIQAYGGELNQVWTNLIDNAVDAMNGDGTLTLRSGVEGEWVYVEVEDDGPGIPVDVQPRIFDPFFTTKEPGQGTGLGLNTTYNIVVKKHGGRIEVDSSPTGTRFVVRLPLDAEGAGDAHRDAEREALAEMLSDTED